MALQATPYKVQLNITDTDLGVYENVRMTVARHPSETEERLAVRLLAYALWYHERLTFGRGLSDVDEPALLRNFFLREMVIPRTNQERPVCDGCNLFFVWECLRGLVFGYRTSSYSNLIYHSLTRAITRTKVPL